MSLSRINSIILILIIVINGYVVIAPLTPILLFSWRNHQGEQSRLTKKLHPQKTTVSSSQIKQPNHIIIPSMLLNSPVLDGPINQQYKILNKGIWRFSAGSTPDKGSNTVLIGHRFTYTNPRGIFYFLNKVKVGSEIGLWWNNNEYLYKVVETKVVPPSDTSIEKPSREAKLTLFTCTPLWLPKNRLVVVANLESQ